MAEKKEIRDFWEIRQSGEVVCAGPVPFLGYPSHALLDMYDHGLYLYKNGKRVKKCQLTLA